MRVFVCFKYNMRCIMRKNTKDTFMGGRNSGMKPSKFLFLGDLELHQSIEIRDARRPEVRDALRRYEDRKFGTRQIGSNVLVTRIN